MLPIAQSFPSSSSGTGVSYWLSAARCGRYVNLAASHKMPNIMERDYPEVKGSTAGIHFHRLQELWHNPSIAKDHLFELGRLNKSYDAAVHSFREYRRFRNKSYFGETIGCELQFPTCREDADFLKEVLGSPFTMRLDRLVRLNQENIDGLCIDFPELQLMPGLYILDYKLQKAHKAEDEWTFGYSVQSKAYVAVYNLLACKHGWEPVSGMLFDVMSRPGPKGATLNNFRVYQSKAMPNDLGVLKAVMQVGRNNLIQNLVNPANCFTAYGHCFYLGHQCDRLNWDNL